MKASGSCLCGDVKFSFDLNEKSFDSCHCSMCRKWGGGPALTVESAGNLEFIGKENIKTFSSSEWAERGFCQNCGSNLFYRLKNHDFINFSLGLIDQHEEFKFTTEIFVDSKPGNYSFSNDTKKMTEKEVLEAFEAGGE